MRRAAWLAALALAAATAPIHAQDDGAASTPIGAASLDRAVRAADAIDFTGVLAAERGDVAVNAELDDNAPEAAWPWASVTKQVVAVMVMQQVEVGKLALDEPASRYLPELGESVPAPTLRRLLQHRSGLRNPDDSAPDADGSPSFYSDGATGLEWCLAERTAPPQEGWRYNNCDYIVLGTLLERVTNENLAGLFAERIAKPAGIVDTRFLLPGETRDFVGADAEYLLALPRYGAAGALVGPASDMLRFDRALLSGMLLGPAAREELWRGDPALGFMALGQWVFDSPLRGCAAPVHIVERRGGIGKYQARNLILPEKDLLMVLLTQDGGFDFGEIWQGKGPMHDILAASACP